MKEIPRPKNQLFAYPYKTFEKTRRVKLKRLLKNSLCPQCKRFVAKIDGVCRNKLCVKRVCHVNDLLPEDEFLVEGQYDPEKISYIFDEAQDACLSSPDVISTEVNSLVYVVIQPHSIPFSVLTVQQQQDICRKLGCSYLSSIFNFSTPRSTLGRPSECFLVTGDGYCFFSSVFLCISGTAIYCHLLRAAVCSLTYNNSS